MSEPAGAGSPATFVPDQRPVRRFVAAIAVVAVALAALWWSGAFAPRLSVACADRVGLASNATVARFELSNQGPLAVELVGTSLHDGGIDAGGVRVDGRPLPGGGARLGGGEAVAVELDLPGPQPTPSSGPAGGLDLVVRTAAGAQHSLWVGTLLSDRSGCPPSS